MVCSTSVLGEKQRGPYCQFPPNINHLMHPWICMKVVSDKGVQWPQYLPSIFGSSLIFFRYALWPFYLSCHLGLKSNLLIPKFCVPPPKKNYNGESAAFVYQKYTNFSGKGDPPEWIKPAKFQAEEAELRKTSAWNFGIASANESTSLCELGLWCLTHWNQWDLKIA